jgi:molecular chaperone GrpE
LRALADAENLRDRTRREKEQAQHLAIKSFAKDLLDVADVLETALESVPADVREDAQGHPHLAQLYKGLSVMRSELMSTFRRNGLEMFDAMDQAFDPNRHQAMFQAPIAGKQPGTVFNVSKKGYLLNGVVIRAAQVGVVQEGSQ